MTNAKAIISIKDLATILVNMFPEKKLKAVFSEQSKDYLQSPVKGNSVDTSKLEKLGWKPSVSIEERIKKTIRSYL